MNRRHLCIIATTLPLLCGLGQREATAQTNNSWTAPIRVQIGSKNFNLSFGVSPSATPGFDAGVDIMTAPPPPARPYAYFALAVFPNFLQRDCRRPSNSITWNLSILNTGGASNTVSWDVSQVPASVNALSLVSSNETVNMLQTTSKTYVGDQSLQIILTLAPLAANAGNNASICLGASTSLNGSASGGSESYTFLWNVQSGPNTSNAQFNDPTLEDPTFTPTLAGAYVLRFTVNDGASPAVFDEVTITVNALPTASVSGSTSICTGGSATLSAALTGSAPWNLTWSDGLAQNGVNSNPATRMVSPASTTTFTVTSVADANCTGTSSGSAIVAVNPLPNVSISGNDPVVTGTTHTYSASTNASNPSYNWSVTGGTINGGNTGSSISVIAGAAGTMVVSVDVTDGVTGCKKTATKNVTVTGSGCTLVADAGADRNVLYAMTTTLGGSPTASGGAPPYTYSWSPTAGLDNSAAANPNATIIPTAGANTITYTVTVTDANSCTATDQVVITVQSFVLLSDGDLTITQNKDSKGDIHSNNKLEFQPGAPGTHIGNLTAKSDITIQTKNTIQGNATAGNNLYLFGTATVTGTKQDHASVATIPVPAYSFSAGGQNKTVPANGSLTLTPGSYDTVRVNSKGTLFLSAGNYYMTTFDLNSSGILSINASAPVNVYVVSSLLINSSVEVKITAGSSANVLFVTLQTPKLEVASKAVLYGTLILPNAPMQFSKNSKIKGAVYAASVLIEPLVKFYHHTSPGAFPRESDVEASEVAKSEVTGYELAQNYPNPFWSEATSPAFSGGNPSTQIKFSVKDAGTVQLSIYNLYGQEIRTLISGQMDSGNHAVNWDGKDNHGQIVPSGIYLYKLRVNGLEQTKKMTFMK